MTSRRRVTTKSLAEMPPPRSVEEAEHRFRDTAVPVQLRLIRLEANRELRRLRSPVKVTSLDSGDFRVQIDGWQETLTAENEFHAAFVALDSIAFHVDQKSGKSDARHAVALHLGARVAGAANRKSIRDALKQLARVYLRLSNIHMIRGLLERDLPYQALSAALAMEGDVSFGAGLTDILREEGRRQGQETANSNKTSNAKARRDWARPRLQELLDSGFHRERAISRLCWEAKKQEFSHSSRSTLRRDCKGIRARK